MSSFEQPESYIIADQLNHELKNKVILNYEIADYEKHQKDNWFNKDETFLSYLINNTILSVESFHAIILINFKTDHILLIGPEYGGKIRYVTSDEKVTEPFHLKLVFTDQDCLFIRIKGFGYCILYDRKDLSNNYVYNRDIAKIIINNEKDFTFDNFYYNLKQKNKAIKSLLVGKDAIIGGVANSLFQEILFKAGIHPKEKSANLTEDKVNSLYFSIKNITEDRIRLGGKNKVSDVYGREGGYIPIMDSSYFNKPCPNCNTKIEKIAIGGGINYFCPNCQPLS